MSWVTLRKSRILEDVHNSLEYMVQEKIVFSETFDETGLVDEYCYCCLSKVPLTYATASTGSAFQ